MMDNLSIEIDGENVSVFDDDDGEDPIVTIPLEKLFEDYIKLDWIMFATADGYEDYLPHLDEKMAIIKILKTAIAKLKEDHT